MNLFQWAGILIILATWLTGLGEYFNGSPIFRMTWQEGALYIAPLTVIGAVVYYGGWKQQKAKGGE